MKTFTVPVFLGVRAETKTDAIEKTLELWEESLYDIDPDTFPYCYVGLERVVIEQEEPK